MNQIESSSFDLSVARVTQSIDLDDTVAVEDANIVVVTEANLQQVIDEIKQTQGEFVLYAMNADSFQALALNFEQIKRFIEEQNQVILYYEKAVQKENED